MARHVTSGKFSPRGTRQPRTEHKRPDTSPPKASAANAAFNKHAARASGVARGATPGQIVASTKTN